MNTSGNKVLITGGSSGIGLALCRVFSEQGNQVIVVGRNAEKLQAVRNEMPEVVTYTCDLSRESEIDVLSVDLLRDHPDLNILINNAGVQYHYHVLDDAHVPTRMHQEIQVNLLAPLRLTALLLPELICQPSAAVVNVTSGLALVPKPIAPVYGATKAALRSFTRTLRQQLQNTSVKVFEIVPPVVRTGMTAGREGRMVSPETVADACMNALARNHYEVRVGKVKLLFMLNRWLPDVAERIIRNSP